MIRKMTMAALAVCLIVPAASRAQDAPRSRPRTRVRTENGPFSTYMLNDNRGRIGVIIDTRANSTRDRIGARISGVTPGGPADDAGLKAGDVITRFNGTALGGVKPDEDEDSGPGMKLIELARELEPGDSVQIEYQRGTETKKSTLVAQDLGNRVWVGGGGSGDFEFPEMRGQMEQLQEMLPKMGNGFSFAFRSPWGGIELVKLNPDLGDDFGTREGVLVVRAPEDSSLALKGGDVILSIGGRKPSSPEQAMRILGTYDEGESVTLDVLRKQKHVSVTWKVPNQEERHFRMMPRMREEPSWYRVAPKIRVRDVIRTRAI